MMMGSTEQRIACLKIAAQMNKRMTKDDPVPTPETIIRDAKMYEDYIKRGWKKED